MMCLLVGLFVCVMCLRVLRVVYDLLYGVSIVLLFVCVLLLICLRDVNMVYCVHVYGLCLCWFVFKRVDVHVFFVWFKCDVFV